MTDVSNLRSSQTSEKWRGIAAISTSVFCLPEPRNTKALFALVLSKALEMLTEQLETVRFVQVGANDGVSADHLNRFITAGRWRGILVEPAPKPFERLKRTYSGISGLEFVQCAIWEKAAGRPFYFVEGEDGLSSFSLETIMAHAPKFNDLQGMIRTLEVETETLDALCDRLGMPEPDLVAVDTEGTDDVVLQTFSIEARRPKTVLFEHCHLSREASQGLQDRFVQAGYRLIHDRHDVLALRQDSFDPASLDFLADVISVARTG